MKEEKRNNHKVEQKRQKGWREGRRDSENGDCKQLAATITTLRHDTFDDVIKSNCCVKCRLRWVLCKNSHHISLH